jgi:hypothetical protein
MRLFALLLLAACGGMPVSPAPADAAPTVSDGGLGLYAPCSGNGDCASGVCHDYPMRGTFCTKPCTAASDCPAPSPGCTPMGVCRVQ